MSELRKVTTRHRFIVLIENEKQWYSVMSECRFWFGKDWQTQRNVKRKINVRTHLNPLQVWFDVPDPRWATWVSTKLAVQVSVKDNLNTDK